MQPLLYGSVCSGIEAATAAWHPLGWKPQWFSEIEAFPSAVLKHHYPTVHNYGDFTKIPADAPAIDILAGGTPCQSFSVAGLRGGLDDDRGNLALEFCRLADRLRPRWIVWENVPGVLSSNGGRDFGSILGAMGELGYGTAYRVLDAQFFGVPQRRRRVFVVGHLGDWRRAAAVLFERHSLSGDSPPRRKAGQGFTHELAPSLTSSGRGVERAGDSRGQDCVIPILPFDRAQVTSKANRSNPQFGDPSHPIHRGEPPLIASTGHISHCLNAGGMGRIDYETETLVTHSLRADGFDASEDGTGRGTPLIPVLASTLKSNSGGGGFGSDPSETFIPVAFSCKDHGGDAGELSPTLRAMEFDGSHANGGGQVAVVFNLRGREGGAMPEMSDVASLRAASGGSSRSYVASSAVRRLTPLECERLQGFEDGYTAVPYRGKVAADGPRYKALGNSMCVDVMRWIGERIQMVEGQKDSASEKWTSEAL